MTEYILAKNFKRLNIPSVSDEALLVRQLFHVVNVLQLEQLLQVGRPDEDVLENLYACVHVGHFADHLLPSFANDQLLLVAQRLHPGAFVQKAVFVYRQIALSQRNV